MINDYEAKDYSLPEQFIEEIRNKNSNRQQEDNAVVRKEHSLDHAFCLISDIFKKKVKHN